MRKATILDPIGYLPLESLPYTDWVCSAGLEDKGDRLHFSTESAEIFGKRYAEAMLQLIHEKGLKRVSALNH